MTDLREEAKSFKVGEIGGGLAMKLAMCLDGEDTDEAVLGELVQEARYERATQKLRGPTD